MTSTPSDTRAIKDQEASEEPPLSAQLETLLRQVETVTFEDSSAPIGEEQSITESESQLKMTTETTYNLHGDTITVNKTATKRTQETALHPKDQRAKLGAKERMDLLEKIQAKQQTVPFHSITVSINDPEKMTNTHSLAKQLLENKRHLLKFDLLETYTIVVPEANAFESEHANYGRLKGKDGTPLQYNLFTDYLTLTTTQVANSSKWYSLFYPDSGRMREDLDWSLAYYEKNVEQSLYSKVHSMLLDFTPDERGGPLFLKLLLDRITTSGESNLKALEHLIKTYKIKSSCQGENIETVVELFTSVFETIHSLRKSDLPADAVKHLLQMLQTTSVDEFNDQFKTLERELVNTETRKEVDKRFVETISTMGMTVLGNDMATARYVLAYAEKTYRNLVQGGEWDACLQKLPTQSVLLTEKTAETPQPSLKFNANDTTLLPEGNTCFNCGSRDHKLNECPHPKDQNRINRNRARHPSSIRRRQMLHKWRPPEEGENNKRVINGTPHTWDPHAGRRGRWKADTTPSDGQPNEGAPPTTPATSSSSDMSIQTAIKTLLAASTPSEASVLGALINIKDGSGSVPSDTSTLATTKATDPMERKLQLHLLRTKIEQELDNL